MSKVYVHKKTKKRFVALGVFPQEGLIMMQEEKAKRGKPKAPPFRQYWKAVERDYEEVVRDL